jgi:hypothetical protein
VGEKAIYAVKTRTGPQEPETPDLFSDRRREHDLFQRDAFRGVFALHEILAIVAYEQKL